MAYNAVDICVQVLLIDLARAKSKASVYAFLIFFRQWTWNHYKVIHKSILNLKGGTHDF